ncbi:hypothetical protein LXA43DRAFT_372317 [Ganoderma leucocontextum]|nr:hypothetical protein LXA43DRAFT_372317 [Ganoderma leucocontextum]
MLSLTKDMRLGGEDWGGRRGETRKNEWGRRWEEDKRARALVRARRGSRDADICRSKGAATCAYLSPSLTMTCPSRSSRRSISSTPPPFSSPSTASFLHLRIFSACSIPPFSLDLWRAIWRDEGGEDWRGLDMTSGAVWQAVAPQADVARLRVWTRVRVHSIVDDVVGSRRQREPDPAALCANNRQQFEGDDAIRPRQSVGRWRRLSALRLKLEV